MAYLRTSFACVFFAIASGHLLLEKSAEAVYEDSLLADLLEEDLAVNLHDEGKAGWWKKSPPPPPPPPPKCTNIAQHSKAHLQKAIRVAAACYSKQSFKDVVNSNLGLRVAHYTQDGPDDLDYGIADPLPNHEKFSWIAFAGSESTEDWRINFQCWKSSAGHGMPGRVHHGFQKQWSHARTDVQRKLNELKRQGIKKIFFTGHSLGAAVASIGAAEMQQNNRDIEIHIITFGGPFFCDDAFAREMNRLMGRRITRVVAAHDPIACIPPFYSGNVAGYTFWSEDSNKWGSKRERSCVNPVTLWRFEKSHHARSFYKEIVDSKC